jgi:hypothetical protein
MALPRPVSYRLDAELHDWVRSYAAERDVAMSAVVEGALIEYRKKVGRMKKGPPLPERTQPVGSRRRKTAVVKAPAWVNGGKA